MHTCAFIPRDAEMMDDCGRNQPQTKYTKPPTKWEIICQKLKNGTIFK